MLLALLRDTFGADAFTAEQVRRLGLDLGRVQRLAARGHVIRLHQGVYCALPADVDRVAVEEAQQFVERHGVSATIGGAAAAVMWGLEVSGGRPILWVPRGSGLRRGSRAGVVIRESDMPGEHCVALNGVPLTTPIRSAIDVACEDRQPWGIAWILVQGVRREAEWLMTSSASIRVKGYELARALDGSDLRGLVTQRLSNILAVHRGRGIAAVRSVAALIDPRLESPLEVRSWLEFHKHGLPMPQPQAWVQGASGRWYRADFRWGRVIGEADGAVKYTSREDLYAEKRRQEDLERAGFIIVRWSWAEIAGDPWSVVACLRRALERAA